MTVTRNTAHEAVGKGDVRVLEIEGGWNVRQKLNQIGIHVGDTIQVRRCGIAGGPVIIRTHGTEIAMGRRMADKIIIQLMETT